MKRAGCDWVVIEVASHALAQHRVWGIKFEATVMTNLTPEHLDYHGTMERYAAAVVEDGWRPLSSVVESQIDLHREYGGVVPEIASRSHLEAILPMVETALKRADKTWSDIDAIGVTHGPGLSGSLLIGSLTARTLAWVYDKPIYGVNHLLGHVYANFLSSTRPSSARDYP